MRRCSSPRSTAPNGRAFVLPVSAARMLTVAAYSAEEWTDFLVASAGASAALAGLVFIGVSINLTRILAAPGLPGRAGQTITVLATALAVSLAVLGPGDSRVAVGLELLLIGLFGWTFIMHIQRNSDEDPATREHRTGQLVLVNLAMLPFIIGGISVLAEWGGGLYWMQAGIILSMLVGLAN